MERAPPFDGVTVHAEPEDEGCLAALRLAALAVTHLLQERFPSDDLLVLDDWHEHDGWVTQSTPLTWAELREQLGSFPSFLSFRCGDEYVAKAIYPRARQFCLRVYVDELATERGGFGSLDVTVPAALADEIARAFESCGLPPEVEDAKAFFDRGYAG